MNRSETSEQLEIAAAPQLRGTEYWREALGHGWTRTSFPSDWPSDQPEAVVVELLGAELTERLDHLSNDRPDELNLLLAATLAALLHRSTGDTEVILGQPVPCGDEGEPPAAGLPLVCLVEDETDLHTLLARTRESVLGALEHRDYPFELIAAEAGFTGPVGRNLLFETALHLDGLHAGLLQPVPVLLEFDRIDGALRLTVRCDPSRYSAESAQRIGRQYRVLLDRWTQIPDIALVDVPLSTDDDLRWLARINETSAPFEDEARIHQLFERQVQATPNAAAVVLDEGIVSYAEFDARANQLARTLVNRGVGADVLVPVIAERSLEMLVAIYAVLKAGGAYLPVDPTYPQDRIRYLLRDSGAQLALVRRSYMGLLPEGVGPIDLDDAASYAADATSPEVSGASSDLAYVIYTSGSTGMPKGVAVEHRSVINRIQWMQKAYPLTPGDVILQKTSISFDVSVWELFWWGFQGASVCLPAPGTEKNPESITRVVQRHGVTVLHFVPSMLGVFLDYALGSKVAGALAGLRQVFTSGEALPPHLAARFDSLMSLSADTRLVNLYGPTEATVDVSHYALPVGVEPTRVPIGAPIDNIRLHVVDQRLRPQPVGIPGELCIAGIGLAREYLGRPELTAEKFVKDPFEGEERVYRTGDLVRWLPDGNLEFLGRIDHQVKLRGYRIEPGEIESVLVGHHGISSVVVVVREDSPGDKRLVAYCIPAGGGMPDVAELRDWCRQSLPDYMVPGWFVTLDALPLTPNGKVDRRALPAPDNDRPDLGAEYVAPRNDIEALIADIWADVLGIDQVGIHDNFFALGGHSLLATRVMNRIELRTGLQLSLKQFFDSPFVAAVAEQLTVREDFSGALVPRGRGENQLQLSFAQQRLWFMDQLEPDSPEYVIPLAFRVNGPLNTTALESAFTALIARHEVLRTRFIANEQGEPAQVIDTPWPFHIQLTDLTTISDQQEREDQARKLVNTEATRPFDLTSGRLLRAHVFQLAPQEHLLLISMHHIVADGWSMGVLTRELREFYQCALDGHPASLPELPVQYADFALWQHQWLSGPVLERQLSYWREQLHGLETLELPTDRPRPQVRSSAGDTVEFTIPADTVAGLRAIAAQHGASLFMVTLAAFQVVLSRWSGQDDIAVGTPIAGRNRPEVEDLVGFFVNTLVMRADLSTNPTFHDLVEQVKNTALAAYTHQDLPFERLVEELAPQRDLSRNALFQVLFVFQNMEHADWGLSGTDIEPFHVTTSTSKFDLSLFLTEDNQGSLVGEVLFATDLFDEATVRRLTSHFTVGLDRASQEPDSHVGGLEILTLGERQEILFDFNRTPVSPAELATIHQLFEQQAALTPDSVAVEAQNARLTYRELNGRANQLAHYLRAQGVGAETLVAVCVDRGLDMIVALLGVLKAGGAYVPLDPDYPDQRLDFMLQDTNAQVVVTQGSLHHLFCESTRRTVILDDQNATISTYSSMNPEPEAGPDNLAYIIYTSGSSGTPKGVMIEHRGVSNHLRFVFESVLPREHFETVLQTASISYDASIREIFGTLAAGGRLVILPPRSMADPAKYLADAVAWGVKNVISCVPSVLRELVRECDASGSKFDTVFLSGERASLLLSDQDCLARNVGRLVNHYGPTECTITAVFNTDYDVASGDIIGRPIANTEVFVMDRFGGLAPVGVPGELWIGGAGVARGYWNRPELTRERFVAHPFSEDPQERVYRTGDLVRWLPDGNLEFLGRIDHQVKLRGLRIELGEIESVLVGHHGISSVVVVVREDSPGDKRLVAYCIPAGGGMPDVAELRDWCRQSLPDYMVPGWFVTLDALPLTPNGKVDRRALPAPDNDRPDLGAEYVAPRNDIEALIADIWADVLGIDQVGIHDNFFALGGHSLKVVTATLRMREAGIDVSVRQVMQNASIAEVAGEFANAPHASRSLALQFPFRGTASTNIPPLFCIHPSGGSAHWYARMAEILDNSCPVYGIQAAGMDPTEQPCRSIAAMADRYWAEMTSIQTNGPYHILGWSLGGLIAHELGRKHAEEIAIVYLLEPPELEPAVRVQMLNGANKYRRAAEIWNDGSTSEGSERDQIEKRFKHFVKSLEFMDESPGLDDWLPFDALGAMLESAAEYQLAPSEANCTLIISEDIDSTSGEEYVSRWMDLYRDRLGLLRVPGGHMDMVKRDDVLTNIAAEVRGGILER